MDTVNHLQDWAVWVQIVAGCVGIFAFFGGLIVWAGRRIVKSMTSDVLDAIDKSNLKIQPNGLNSLELGDTAARTERKVDELRVMFRNHLLHHAPDVPSGQVASALTVNDDWFPEGVPTRAEVRAEVEQVEGDVP